MCVVQADVNQQNLLDLARNATVAVTQATNLEDQSAENLDIVFNILRTTAESDSITTDEQVSSALQPFSLDSVVHYKIYLCRFILGEHNVVHVLYIITVRAVHYNSAYCSIGAVMQWLFRYRKSALHVSHRVRWS